MRRAPLLTAAVVVALLAVAGCGRSSVPDDAEVTISGTLTLPDGSPASGVTVGLLNEPGGLDVLFELAVTVASIGLLCLAREVTICDGVRTTTTGPDGGYAFTLRGADTKTTFGNPGRFVLSAQLPPGEGQVAGPGVQTRFAVDDTAIAVPDVSLWDPAGFAVDTGREALRYHGAEHPDAGEYTVVASQGDDVAWSEPGGPDGQVDARAVGDLVGALHVTAQQRRQAAGTAFTTSYRTPQLPVRGMAGRPASRGVTCTVAGPEPLLPISPCPVTDGRYGEEFPATSCPAEPTGSSATPEREAEACAANRWAALDLGQRRPVGTLFVHGLAARGAMVVEISDDGTGWTPVTTGELAPFERVDLPGGTTARQVRLRLDDPAARISRLAELSVWP